MSHCIWDKHLTRDDNSQTSATIPKNIWDKELGQPKSGLEGARKLQLAYFVVANGRQVGQVNIVPSTGCFVFFNGASAIIHESIRQLRQTLPPNYKLITPPENN